MAARDGGTADRRRRLLADVGAIQIVPAVGLLIALAFLLDLSVANFGPAANDNASGTAVALALARPLDADPPPGIAVDVLLHGAGEGGGIGLRRYLRAHRSDLEPADTVVLGIAPSGAGGPSWWHSDGRPCRFATRRSCATSAPVSPPTSRTSTPRPTEPAG